MFKAILGFIVLFLLYHSAEYMIVFRNNAAGFLGFQLLFFFAAWLTARWQLKPGLAAWGLDFGRHVLKHLLFGLVIGVLLYGLTLLISVLIGSEKIVSIPAMTDATGTLALFVFGSFFSSVSEDILTRGYVWNHLRGRFSAPLIGVISSVIYVLNHIYRLDDGPEPYIYLFLRGVVFVVPLLITKRLWITAGMHWAGNVVFYLTHEIWKTKDVEGAFSSNYLLATVSLLFAAILYYVLKRAKIFSPATLPGR